MYIDDFAHFKYVSVCAVCRYAHVSPHIVLVNILKHFREFVQSVFDTARGALEMFHAHAPGPGFIH